MRLIPTALLITGYIQSKQHVFNSTNSLVNKLQEYIRFNTVSQETNYSGVTQWLKSYINDIGLEYSVIYCNVKKPIVIGTWKGSNPSLQSILINSHYDVVPVNKEYWNVDPFGGELGEVNGEQVIYGRGSQDDKSLTIMQLEALRALKNGGFEPKRTIHITIVPDEELYSDEGMSCLVKTRWFKAMNVGAALDEGFMSQDPEFLLFHGERASWGVNATATGSTGHASKFIQNLAISKLQKFIQFAELYRKRKRKTNTMNLALMGGGTANNVVPDTLWAYYNIRVSPTIGSQTTKKLLNKWASRAGVNLTYFNDADPTISLNDSNAHFYNTVINTTKEFGVDIKTQIFPGGTDSRYLRESGIPAYSITPCANVETLAHDHNEYLPVRCLQAGVLFYENLLPKLSNLNEL
ncbi:Zn-dependent exopeptidase [Conidiobolus coronatus NRRL 28638]|uniref:Zn-dependent exopeptidase n=1 Tax=Conidiobolus coronatus (strain ATCC 28846 / CBS 209.66 / NRRL 28638) TaxID=796925 RepID=A0A137NUK2_CONC2|nr:Zn-dependent exopeptidase [Conidiobolus coronatus NRRL 28638]|eukprot:KXN66402.1 Zn-dependent exopeptidase [Conidiobolus coronatus NRRL 28638]